jgi:hypothetical protein
MKFISNLCYKLIKAGCSLAGCILPFSLESQELPEFYPPKHHEISDSTFRAYTHLLQVTFPELSRSIKNYPAFSIVIYYCHLKAAPDTIWNAIQYAIKIDSMECCKLDFSWALRNKIIKSSITPKQYFEYRKICDTVFKRVDSSLIKELVKIKQRDEQIRDHHTYEEIRTNKKLQDEMVHLDTINMRHIDDILRRYGRYPGKKLVDEMSEVVASVIQHSPYANQKKYLPYIEKAVYDHDLRPIFLAVMTDRILMIENKPQIYGSQIIYDEKQKKEVLYKYLGKVNDLEKRREILRLITLKKYLRNFYPYIEYPKK